MDGDWLIEREGLRGIVMLLFSLAGLADRAAKAPPSVRHYVLMLLGPAEVIARRLVSGAGADDPLFALFAFASSQAYADAGPAEAARLAARLRALASLLATRTPPILAQHWSAQTVLRLAGCLKFYLGGRLAPACDALEQPFYDTS